VARRWPPDGHRLTDWRAATLQLAAAAIDNLSQGYLLAALLFGQGKFMSLNFEVIKNHWHFYGRIFLRA